MQPKREGTNSRNVVLVIDDSDIDRQAMADLLTDSGFDVHVLPSPIGATRLARYLEVRVVVIDQNLPAMDGSKLATLFRGNPALSHVRVVLVSGNDERMMSDIVRNAKADAFVSKKSIHQALASTVKRLAS
jgi:CheY-like chemotaxis protein